MNDKNYNSYLQTVNTNSPTRKGSPKKEGGGGSTTKPQPRFIRKKPQLIQSIEFCKELKTSYLDDDQNTPSQAKMMSPGKIRQNADVETPSQKRTSSLVYHQQKGEDSSHQEVYDYDEELMHAQAPNIQGDEEVYKTYGYEEEEESAFESSPKPHQYPPPQHSVIHEVTEYSSLPPLEEEKKQGDISGLTFTLNNTTSVMNITDQQLLQHIPKQPNDIEIIKNMMEDLRKKKQLQLQQLMQVKPPFHLEPSDDQRTDSDYHSGAGALTTKRRSKQDRTPAEKQSSPQAKKTAVNTQKSPQVPDIETLKQKKIEEIKSMIINERSSQQPPIQPFRSNPKAVEEDYKTENGSKKYNSREAADKSPSLRGHQLVSRPKTAHPQSIKDNTKTAQSNEQRKQALKSAIQQKAQQQTRNFQSFKPSQFSTQNPPQPKELTRNATQQQIGFDSKPNELFTTMQPSGKPSLGTQRSPRTTSPVPQSAAQYAAQHTLASIAPHLLLSPSQQHLQDQYRHLTSERTQQIVFKKLQKEVEGAIRAQDHGDKGALNMEEFKNCLYTLDYLGYMQAEEEEQRQQQHLRRFYNGQANPRQHVTTKKSMVMQEKEFVYNFWCIVNPMNQTEIDNAMLYDVLLLMIYNVQQPLHVTINYLTEYLENHYKDHGIDLDSFAGYNSGSSQGTGGSPDHPRPNREDLSNISKYLSYTNLWPIERLTFEFRQVHASKLGHQFSSQTSKKRTSVSPIGNNDNDQTQTLVNPSDGRRYKKTVIEDHLSNLTFSPRISNKTKELDQRLTQKLLNNNPPSLKRDASADVLAQKSSSNFTLNLEPVQTNPVYEMGGTQGPNFKRYDLLYFRQQMTQQKIEKAKESKNLKQLEECTFHPKLSTDNSLITGTLSGTLISSKSYQNLQKQTNHVFKDLTDKVKTQRSKLFDHTEASKAMAQHTAQILKDEKELEECTFKPKINPINAHNNNRTPKRQENESIAANQLPRGYYQMVNRMRKVNEEKRALEEKIHKKVIGENYDRVKLMNLKPPSFVQGQTEKKKRKLLMYIDVNITPVRTGRIGIYEGDDVRELARNFQKTFQLNNNMLGLLTQQLEQHLQIYKEKNGLTDVQGSTFPPERNEDNGMNGGPSGFHFSGSQNFEAHNIFTQNRPEEELKSTSDLIRHSNMDQNQVPNFPPETSNQNERTFGIGHSQPFDNQTGKRSHFNQASNPNFFVPDEDSPRQELGHHLRGDEISRYSQRAQTISASGGGATGRRTEDSSGLYQESSGASSDRTRVAGVDQPGFFGIPLSDINIQQLTHRNTMQNANMGRSGAFY